MNVLCLHGGQQTADIFENQISKLCLALGSVATFAFMDAPFLLPLKDERDDVQTRSWCSETGDYSQADALLDERMTSGEPVDVLLGFSQGGMMICRYVMRQMLQAKRSTVADGKDKPPRSKGVGPGQQKALPLPKGVILAGTPDPRRAFDGSSLLSDYQAEVAGGDGSGAFFASLPSLHIVGKKDAIVPPEDSAAFAKACGAAGELVLHEHAHSFPQQVAVIAAVRGFCEGVAVDPAELAALAEQRDMEVDMVAAMYAPQCGDDCVRRPRAMSGGAVVTLPLLSADAVETGSAAAAAMERALSRVSLRLHLPRRYPAVLPDVDVVNGPAWHSVAFERWRAETVGRCRQHLLEDVGLGSAMVLPVHMYACELAMSELDRLKVIFSPEKHAGEEGEDGDDQHGASPAKVSAWTLEDDDARAVNIEEAEKQAMSLLLRKLTDGKHAADDADPLKGAGEAGGDADGGGGGGMGLPTKSGGGSWTLTIGLIGKPSAGKSTFFNAVTDPQSESDAARVAAFPFTTIEPNVGTGFGGLLCPCKALLHPGTDAAVGSGARLKPGFAACDAAYGHVMANGCACHRRHPILVKDVAGLVQGAYQGKGKGNQFLNDLCDADVLVHVVDGAGATDADGSACPAGQGSTLNDISWVRAEVHSWIYDNVRAKWDSIRRVPGKLRFMFSGYRSSPMFIDAVLLRMGIANETALKTQVPAWGPRELHTMVALYTRMRFPMVIALNKADLPTATGLAQQLRQRYPDEVFVPVSAKAEWDLLTLRKKGLIEYLSGRNSFVDLSEQPGYGTVAAAAGAGGASATTTGPPVQLAKEDAERLRRLHAFFTTTIQPSRVNGAGASAGAAGVPLVLTSTGVQDVLAEALSRCAAVLVYPVSAFQPTIPSLKHCFSFKPGTTAEDVFWAMTYAKLLDGKLVRFEVVDALLPPPSISSSASPSSAARASASISCHTAPASGSGGPMTLKKMDQLPSRAVFVRVLSNKRQMT